MSAVGVGNASRQQADGRSESQGNRQSADDVELNGFIPEIVMRSPHRHPNGRRNRARQGHKKHAGEKAGPEAHQAPAACRAEHEAHRDRRHQEPLVVQRGDSLENEGNQEKADTAKGHERRANPHAVIARFGKLGGKERVGAGETGHRLRDIAGGTRMFFPAKGTGSPVAVLLQAASRAARGRLRPGDRSIVKARLDGGKARRRETDIDDSGVSRSKANALRAPQPVQSASEQGLLDMRQEACPVRVPEMGPRYLGQIPFFQGAKAGVVAVKPRRRPSARQDFQDDLFSLSGLHPEQVFASNPRTCRVLTEATAPFLRE